MNEVVAVWVAIAVVILISTLRGLYQAYRVVLRSWAWPQTLAKEEIRIAAQGQAFRETVRLLAALLYLGIGIPLLDSPAVRWTPLTTMLVVIECCMLVLSIADQTFKYLVIRTARKAGNLP